jgi:hypothetical protein
MDLYTHSGLDRSTDEIRLARFLSVDEKTIRLSIEKHTLSDALIHGYFALSYEWGTPKSSVIIVDNKPFSIRQNLEQALRALWNYFQDDSLVFSRPFWADALCIDQNNVTERGHQVKLMGKIYSSAYGVLIWLGQAECNSGKAVDFIRNCGRRRREPEDGVAEAILALFERPYWGRLWIVQEILMARNAWVFCGQRCIPLAELSKCLGVLPRLEQTTIDIHDGQAGSLIHDKKSQDEDGFKPFLDLGMAIFKYGHQGCTDVRDKVYGLLGLVDFKGREPITPDYSLTAEEVCELVSTYFSQDPDMKKSEAEYYTQICMRSMGLPPVNDNELAIKRLLHET